MQNHQAAARLTRRALFSRAAQGIGAAALASLLGEDNPAAAAAGQASIGGALGAAHHAPRAKKVIYLLMNGAPPHVDMFDYKPELERWRGKEIPESVHKNQRVSTMTQGAKKLALPAFTGFKQHGQSGAWVCDFLPHIASIADDACFIRSLHTSAVNHAPAITFFLTGSEQPGRPSMGAWATYGLGTETQDLPGFVVMTSRDKEASCGQIFYDFYWGSGFLPSKYQGVKFRGAGDPVLYLSNPDGVSRDVRRGLLDDLAAFNEEHYAHLGDPEIATRITQYEMAYRMQASVPELANLANEPKNILEMYGPDVTRAGSFAHNCLMARRLVERGVRFVQLFHAGWDHHRNLSSQFEIQCRDTDQPGAALVKDLKQRGLLDDTLVIWAGEFGRTPFIQGDINDRKQWGRDHHPYAFTIWMAGGGIKPGMSYGASDDFGFNVADKPVDVHDFQATVLHLLGVDHERLTFRFQGRQYRLTDVHGKVVRESWHEHSMSVIGILVISLVMGCAVAGAIASLFDSEKGLGKEFLDGLHAIGYIFVPVAGIMAAIPFLSQLVRAVAGPVYSAVGADPAMAATSFIAVDMGGYQLARGLTEVHETWIMAMMTGYMAGATIVFSIPVGLAMLDKQDHPYMALGVLSGVLSIPIGVLISSALLWLLRPSIRPEIGTEGPASYQLALSLSTILVNLAPLAIIVALIALGLHFVPQGMIRGFMVFGRIMDIGIKLIVVSCIVEYFTTIFYGTGAFTFVFGSWGFAPIIADEKDQLRALEVAGYIGTMLTGAFPMVYLIKKHLARPMEKLGRRLGLESAGAAGLLAAAANILAMFRLIREMRPKDKVLCIAFAVCGAFLLGDHLAFTANFQPTLIVAVMAGKLGGGVAGFVLAYRLSVPKALEIEKQQQAKQPGDSVHQAPGPIDHPSAVLQGHTDPAQEPN